MALTLSPPSITSPFHLLNNRIFLRTIHLHRSSPPSASNSRRCQAVSPGRPPPPESEPPSGKGPPSSAEGLVATFARLQDTVQIFFAVLFWMSLFFWSSVWDGRNNDRPSKGSRFRR
ncbi:hypothetical protein Vadar_006032 [Vaccinium darrowii]|uniref:Uncharacterized protein n=1 Tax=Vaccinium darrowii TaxID=229202 RepID=A0ACB7YT24_9ERIC|nr:hypothetical protein Vadar_006032 [Vaccinium darrowii]